MPELPNRRLPAAPVGALCVLVFAILVTLGSAPPAVDGSQRAAQADSIVRPGTPVPTPC